MQPRIDRTAPDSAEARECPKEIWPARRAELFEEMAAWLAHELNQPLTGILNNASAGRRFIALGAR
jgi:C4-dicarboxylate-specific signal transduction histidine kinase